MESAMRKAISTGLLATVLALGTWFMTMAAAPSRNGAESGTRHETIAMATSHRLSGDYQGAIQALERAVALDSQDKGALQALAAAYAQQADKADTPPAERRRLIEQGLACVDRAIDIDPLDFGALVTKSVLLRALSQLATTDAERTALGQEADAVREHALRAGLETPRPAATIDMVDAPEPPPPPPPPGHVAGDIVWTYGSIEYTVTGSTQLLQKVRDVRPIYPPAMIGAGVSGRVVLDATVDGRGRVRDIRVIEAAPLLYHTTIDAVRQWRFDPEVAAAAAGPIAIRVIATFPAEH